LSSRRCDGGNIPCSCSSLASVFYKRQRRQRSRRGTGLTTLSPLSHLFPRIAYRIGCLVISMLPPAKVKLKLTSNRNRAVNESPVARDSVSSILQNRTESSTLSVLENAAVRSRIWRQQQFAWWLAIIRPVVPARSAYPLLEGLRPGTAPKPVKRYRARRTSESTAGRTEPHRRRRNRKS